MAVKKRKKGIFIVHVYYGENATWQGEIVWADKNEKKNFRSALELLKIMDNALEPASQAFSEAE